jgi:hypothetical protein
MLSPFFRGTASRVPPLACWGSEADCSAVGRLDVEILIASKCCVYPQPCLDFVRGQDEQRFRHGRI